MLVPRQNASDRFQVQSAFNGRRYWVQFEVDSGDRSGGISSLVELDGHGREQRVYADEHHVLGQFVYQTMTEKDFDVYIDSFYFAWTSHTDYGKYRLSEFANFTEHQYVVAQFKRLYVLKEDENEFLVEMDFGVYHQDLPQNYGAMQSVFNRISFNSESAAFAMELVIINKTFSRIPECYYFTFLPLDCGHWRVHKIESMVDVGDIMKNGSYHMHGVIGNTSCDLRGDGQRMDFRSLHSGLVAFKPLYTNASSDFYDEFTVFPTPLLNASETDGFAYVLGNNAWGTNYPQWYPFDAVTMRLNC